MSLGNHLLPQNPSKKPQSPAKDKEQYLLGKSLVLASWREIATTAEFPHEKLWPAETEILDMMERVLIRGKGWNHKDKCKGLRDRIPISPRKLSKHGRKLSPRTYCRAIKRLNQLGLLIHGLTGPNQVRVFYLGWWPTTSNEEAISVWAEASTLFRNLNKTQPDLRTPDGPMSDLGRTDVAPPVPQAPAPSSRKDSCSQPQGATNSHTATENGNGKPNRSSE